MPRFNVQQTSASSTLFSPYLLVLFTALASLTALSVIYIVTQSHPRNHWLGLSGHNPSLSLEESLYIRVHDSWELLPRLEEHGGFNEAAVLIGGHDSLSAVDPWNDVRSRPLDSLFRSTIEEGDAPEVLVALDDLKGLTSFSSPLGGLASVPSDPSTSVGKPVLDIALTPTALGASNLGPQFVQGNICLIAHASSLNSESIDDSGSPPGYLNTAQVVTAAERMDRLDTAYHSAVSLSISTTPGEARPDIDVNTSLLFLRVSPPLDRSVARALATDRSITGPNGDNDDDDDFNESDAAFHDAVSTPLPSPSTSAPLLSRAGKTFCRAPTEQHSLDAHEAGNSGYAGIAQPAPAAHPNDPFPPTQPNPVPDPDDLPLPQLPISAMWPPLRGSSVSCRPSPFSRPAPLQTSAQLPDPAPRRVRAAHLTHRPSWSLRALDAPALGVPADSFARASVASRSQDSSTEIALPTPSPKLKARPPLPVDVALAMQLRPGLGIGADGAWLVRFLMAVFGWFSVLLGGQAGKPDKRLFIGM
jgi:hypothetical protein